MKHDPDDQVWPSEEVPSAEYTVRVDGRPVFVHQARVSAQPFNQVWPGYQRPIEQTELAAFASLAMTGPVEVVAQSAREINEVKVRPAARGIEPVVEGRTLRFILERPGQVTVEINGMHHALHLFADAPEASAPQPGDPNVLYFGPGVHCAGAIHVTSGQAVYLAAGAVVYGGIVADDAENIAILGRGILDGSKFTRGDVSGLINLTGCKHVKIEGVILRDSPAWTLIPACCEHVDIRNIKLIGMWRYNADGVDFVNSRHCTLEDSFIRTFDDCVVFKGFSTWNERPTHAVAVTDVRVRRCVFWCDWGRALEVGAETAAEEISDLVFEDCDIIHSLDVAMEVQNGDRAHCHDLLFRDIRVELDDDQTQPGCQAQAGDVYGNTARHLSQLIVLVVGANMWSKDTVRGRTSGIRFENVQVSAWDMPECWFAGLDEEHQVSDVVIENLTVNGRRLKNTEEGRFIIKPFVERLSLR